MKMLWHKDTFWPSAETR